MLEIWAWFTRAATRCDDILARHKTRHASKHNMSYDIDANGLVAELAKLLHIDEIDENALRICIKLIDQGVDPQSLAESIRRIKHESTVKTP